jgi:hypothetical protein
MLVMVKFMKVILVSIDAGKKTSILLLLLGGGCDDVAHVALDHFDQFLGDRSGVVHAGTHVDLDDPWIQVFIDHEVVAYHFEKSLLARH